MAGFASELEEATWSLLHPMGPMGSWAVETSSGDMAHHLTGGEGAEACAGSGALPVRPG